MCVAQYNALKHKRGRKLGSLKTKQEDKQIMKAFHKMGSPGHGVFAWQIQTAMPKAKTNCQEGFQQNHYQTSG